MEEVTEHFTGQYSLVRAGNLEVGCVAYEPVEGEGQEVNSLSN